MRLTATDLADYVRLKSCERRLWYALHREETKRLLEDYAIVRVALDEELAESGARHEAAALRDLASGAVLIDLTGQPSEQTYKAIAASELGRTILYQATIEGRLGAVDGIGIPDAVEISKDSTAVLVRVIDMKASRREKVEHRLQVAFYCRLLRCRLAQTKKNGADSQAFSLSGAILRPADPLAAFDPAPYERAIERLAAGSDSLIQRIIEAPRAEVEIHLARRCGGCPFHRLCSREAAEIRSLSLVHDLSPGERHRYESIGIETIDALAELKTPKPDEGRLVPAEGSEEILERLESDPILARHIDRHIQCAQGLRMRDGTGQASPAILGSPGSTLPPDDAGSGLGQVFLDFHYDYVRDKVTLLCASVGPPTSKPGIVVERAASPDEQEDALVRRFSTRLIDLLLRSSEKRAATLHVYLWDSAARGLLGRLLWRNVTGTPEVETILNLFAEHPNLAQPMLSLLDHEVRRQLNLGLVSHSLDLVAAAVGSSLPVDSLPPGSREENFAVLESGIPYQSALKFGADFPKDLIRAAFAASTPEEQTRVDRALANLAKARLEAMRRIERRLLMKNRLLGKKPIPLRLLESATRAVSVPLEQRMKEFLFLEHQARLQELLHLYSLPIDQRIAAGHSLKLCALDSSTGGRTAFALDCKPGTAPLLLGSTRVHEGDWMVISPETVLHPLDLLRGRLCIVLGISASGLELDLLPMSFGRSRLRYPHRRDQEIAKDGIYTLDPMADDLVGERLLDACEHAKETDFLDSIASKPRKRQARQPAIDAARRLRDILFPEGSDLHITDHQMEAALNMEDQILLIQGPPGTGKTFTAAFSILARMAAAADAGRPMRVLAAATTHTAVDLLLSWLAKLLARLPASSPLLAVSLLRESTGDRPLPDRCRPLSRETLSRGMKQPLAVIGSSPAGVHRLLKNLGRGRVRFQDRLFDLLVIDEASQVGLPAALLCGAPLKKAGQALIVGDHRQMPPINARRWLSEQPEISDVHCSIFEFLRNRGFPCLALDVTFRLQESHASFLARHIYHADGVPLRSHSSRKRVKSLLPPSLPPLVRAILDPDYPIVIVQHDERGSLRQNLLEASIVREIAATLTEMGRNGDDELGIVVPYRAQRALLQDRLPHLKEVGAIDTVERFQGGERDIIIISATASDPDSALAESSFLLDPNRFNVAISRPREKLILVASSVLFTLMPSELRLFEAALIWKELEAECDETLFSGSRQGVAVRVSGKRRAR